LVLAMAKAPRDVRTFCATLHATGCRVSEALARTAKRIDLAGRVAVFESLKKRRRGVFRAVPVAPSCRISSTSCRNGRDAPSHHDGGLRQHRGRGGAEHRRIHLATADGRGQRAAVA
jgi:integrase